MRCRLLLNMLAGVALAQNLPTDRTLSSEAPAWLLAYRDGGKTLAALCGDGKLRVWDAQSGVLRQTAGKEPLSAPGTYVRGADQFATLTRDGSIQLWDAKTASEVGKLPALTPRAGRLALSS